MEFNGKYTLEAFSINVRVIVWGGGISKGHEFEHYTPLAHLRRPAVHYSVHINHNQCVHGEDTEI